VPGIGAVPVIAHMRVDGPVAVLACALCELGAVAAVRVVEVIADWDSLVECGGSGCGRAPYVAASSPAAASAHGGLGAAASPAAPSAVARLWVCCRAGRHCASAAAAG
jgi:hypothetical protein